MKLSKAIEHLQTEATLLHAQGFSQRGDAVLLGIEALKRCQLKQPSATFNLGKPLAGETKE